MHLERATTAYMIGLTPDYGLHGVTAYLMAVAGRSLPHGCTWVYTARLPQFFPASSPPLPMVFGKLKLDHAFGAIGA
jgi:hypothetical protein